MRKNRTLVPFGPYFWEFYNGLEETLQEKVDYVLQILISADRIPMKFFRHLEDGIYEIRIAYKSNIYRIFSFFDKGKIVILLHGIQKKSQKLNRVELERARRLRNAYYENK
jgi:phage-related protein